MNYSEAYDLHKSAGIGSILWNSGVKLGKGSLNLGRAGLKHYGRSLSRAPLKTLSGTVLGGLGLTAAGSVAAQAIHPGGPGGVVLDRILSPVKNRVVQFVPQAAQRLAQTLTQEHTDKHGVKKAPVLQTIGKSVQKNLTPIVRSGTTQVGQGISNVIKGVTGTLKGGIQQLGNTLQNHGGGVLTGFGGAGLGYTGAGLLYDLFKPVTSKKDLQRRRTIQLLSAIAGGALGVRYSSNIFKALKR